VRYYPLRLDWHYVEHLPAQLDHDALFRIKQEAAVAHTSMKGDL